MNALQKLHALAVSELVQLWHYPSKPEGPRFVYWTKDEIADEAGGHWFDTLESLIDAAYEVIDPQLMPMPEFKPPESRGTGQ